MKTSEKVAPVSLDEMVEFSKRVIATFSDEKLKDLPQAAYFASLCTSASAIAVDYYRAFENYVKTAKK